jgi:arsenite-transporting ATPase
LRLLLFTGKGGAGKTTIAAATATHAARCGIKTLVMSTDSAHSLADVLEVPVDGPATAVAPGLFAEQVDTRARAQRTWDGVQEYLAGVLDELGVDPLAADDLAALPGGEQVLALLEVRDRVREGSWDLVVVDCAPTGETVRLLALPELMARVLARLLPVERRVARAVALGAAPALRRAGMRVPRDHVAESVDRLCAELGETRELLTSASASVRVVLTPEAVVLAEARRTWTALALHGYLVDGVVANRVLPPGGDPWRSSWAQQHARRLAEARASFAGLPVYTLGYADAEPSGPEALAELGEELYGPVGDDAAAQLLADPSAPTPPVQVRRTGEDFVLELSLPLVGKEDVDLSRAGDELVLAVGEHHRVVTLPSALRRCRVVGARITDGSLQVRFTPDPALWRRT